MRAIDRILSRRAAPPAAPSYAVRPFGTTAAEAAATDTAAAAASGGSSTSSTRTNLTTGAARVGKTVTPTSAGDRF